MGATNLHAHASVYWQMVASNLRFIRCPFLAKGCFQLQFHQFAIVHYHVLQMVAANLQCARHSVSANRCHEPAAYLPPHNIKLGLSFSTLNAWYPNAC